MTQRLVNQIIYEIHLHTSNKYVLYILQYLISVCGSDETVMSCSPLFLATAKCPFRPDAVPLINPCGGCSVSFYVEGKIVEDCLERKISLANIH